MSSGLSSKVGETCEHCTPLLRGGSGHVPYCPKYSEYIESIRNPQHYKKHPSNVECIQIVEHMGFNLGNAIKYIWRADLKGSAIEDLEKAAWYVNRELERRRKASTDGTPTR